MLILFYIFDSLRRDFLGSYGDSGALSPHLDVFAAEATRFTHAYAAAPWSKASGAALLTGYLPRAVRMRGLLDRLPPSVPTLAEQLTTAGFRTIAVSANPFISHDFGLLRGFDTTVEAFRPGTLPSETFQFHANHFRRLAEQLSVEPSSLVLARSQALHEALLQSTPATGHSFVLCWSMDTHAPFFVRGERSYFGNPLERVIPAADAEWLKEGVTARDMISLYRDMIAYNDQQFGALVQALRARGQWDEALVVVTGDHGEAFGEHGIMGHTNGLWEEQITVPLLVKMPGQTTSATCATPVALMDLAATVGAILDLPRNNGDGVPLQAVVAGQAPERALLLESPDGWAIRAGSWKAVAPTEERAPLLFNIESDPREQRPLADDTLRRDLLARAASLRAAADTVAARWEETTSLADDAVLERLRALGYL